MNKPLRAKSRKLPLIRLVLFMMIGLLASDPQYAAAAALVQLSPLFAGEDLAAKSFATKGITVAGRQEIETRFAGLLET